MSWPDLPDCVTLARTLDVLTVRDTPAAFGRKLGSIPAGTIVRVDKSDVTLLYQHPYRYIRLINIDGQDVFDEPAYIALGKVEGRGYRDIVMLERYLVAVRDECPDSEYGVPPFDPVPDEPPERPGPDIPEIPEDELADYELSILLLNVALPYLHDKLGTEALKAKLAPSALVAMQELIVGTSTPDVEPPVEPEPEPEPVPDVPPVETFPPEPETPPVVPPLPATARNTTPFEARGNRIYKDGVLFNKFIGVNHRGLAWYGMKDVLPYSYESQIAQQLDFDKNLGVQVVRFYAAHEKHSVETAIPLVKRILDMLQARGMWGVVCLTDGAHSGFHAPDNPGNRGVYVKGNERYSKAWIEEKKYRDKYLPYATEMVKAISNHPAIFSIQPINELTTIDDNPTERYMNAVLEFYEEVIGMIRRESPNSMTSTGAVSAHELFGFAADGSRNAYTGFKGAEKLYRLVDYASVHSYQDEKAPDQALGSTRENLVHEFKLAGIPHIWEEMNGLTSDPTTNWMDKALHASAQAVVGWMLWNPCWDIGDNNDCDGLNPAKDGHNGARKHNYQGWVNAWANNLRLAT